MELRWGEAIGSAVIGLLLTIFLTQFLSTLVSTLGGALAVLLLIRDEGIRHQNALAGGLLFLGLGMGTHYLTLPLSLERYELVYLSVGGASTLYVAARHAMVKALQRAVSSSTDGGPTSKFAQVVGAIAGGLMFVLGALQVMKVKRIVNPVTYLPIGVIPTLMLTHILPESSIFTGLSTVVGLICLMAVFYLIDTLDAAREFIDDPTVKHGMREANSKRKATLSWIKSRPKRLKQFVLALLPISRGKPDVAANDSLGTADHTLSDGGGSSSVQAQSSDTDNLGTTNSTPSESDYRWTPDALHSLTNLGFQRVVERIVYDPEYSFTVVRDGPNGQLDVYAVSAEERILIHARRADSFDSSTTIGDVFEEMRSAVEAVGLSVNGVVFVTDAVLPSEFRKAAKSEDPMTVIDSRMMCAWLNRQGYSAPRSVTTTSRNAAD